MWNGWQAHRCRKCRSESQATVCVATAILRVAINTSQNTPLMFVTLCRVFEQQEIVYLLIARSRQKK